MPHINEKLDLCSEVFIVFNNKVLLRKHDKYHIWLSVGGHIEPDEDPCEAAIREAEEEVGLEIELYDNPKLTHLNSNKWKSLPKPMHVCRHDINDTHEHFVLIYYAKTKNDKIKLSNTEITKECKWFTKEEIDINKEINEDIKFYAKEALSILS